MLCQYPGKRREKVYLKLISSPLEERLVKTFFFPIFVNRYFYKDAISFLCYHSNWCFRMKLVYFKCNVLSQKIYEKISEKMSKTLVIPDNDKAPVVCRAHVAAK